MNQHRTGTKAPNMTSSSPNTLVAMRAVPELMATRLRGAANELLANFDDLQMHDVALVAGVARSSLYYYFASKDDVLAFLLRAALDDLTDATGLVASGPGSPAERLGAVIRAQLEHLNAHPSATQLLVANLGRAGRLPDIAARVNLGFEEPVRRLLEAGATDGSLRQLPDSDLGASALFGAVLVIGLRSLVVDGEIDVEKVTSLLAPMFWSGIAPSPDAPLPL